MDRIYFNFGFRFESSLHFKIKQHCEKRTISLNELVDRAFRFVAALHDSRKIFFDCASNFALREDTGDKIERKITLEPELRETLKNFSVAYQMSMAEILRISLEAYLDFLESDGGKNGIIKHTYRDPQDTILCSIIGIFPAFAPKAPPDPLWNQCLEWMQGD